MILVDTSVWVRFLAGREPYATELDRLLMENDVLAHEFVYGELLLGDRGGRTKLLTEYDRMQRAPTVRHGEVLALVRSRDLHGRGIGWVDAHLLASALVEQAHLWTADEGLLRLAREAGVAHDLRSKR
jgi:predicted nucleic acid-binding protein